MPPARAGVSSGVLTTAQQSALALGVATLGTLFLSLIPGMGMRNDLVTTLLVQLAGVALTGLLSLRLPRTIGRAGPLPWPQLGQLTVKDPLLMLVLLHTPCCANGEVCL